MGISEEQFENMLRGTIHEGKYGKNKPKEPEPKEVAPTREKPTRIVLDSKAQHTVFETMALMAPWLLLFKLIEEPFFWILLLIVLFFAMKFIGPVLGFIYAIATCHPAVIPVALIILGYLIFRRVKL